MKPNSAHLKIGFQHVASVPQLLAKFDDSGVVVFLVIKIIEDFLPCGPEDVLRPFRTSIGDTFKVGTVFHGSEEFYFYGM